MDKLVKFSLWVGERGMVGVTGKVEGEWLVLLVGWAGVETLCLRK